MSDVIELFGEATLRDQGTEWDAAVERQWCPFLDRKCMKIRKSRPEIAMGTCSVFYGKAKRPLVICPFRLLERRRIFVDCLHLLSTHGPGNELHIVPEVRPTAVRLGAGGVFEVDEHVLVRATAGYRASGSGTSGYG